MPIYFAKWNTKAILRICFSFTYHCYAPREESPAQSREESPAQSSPSRDRALVEAPREQRNRKSFAFWPWHVESLKLSRFVSIVHAYDQSLQGTYPENARNCILVHMIQFIRKSVLDGDTGIQGETKDWEKLFKGSKHVYSLILFCTNLNRCAL